MKIRAIEIEEYSGSWAEKFNNTMEYIESGGYKLKDILTESETGYRFESTTDSDPEKVPYCKIYSLFIFEERT